ncbi:hypothetical protein SCHPADRAFT_939941 [Schizopora paradoxa]|uniref:Uncharacterized protein n=1 Tax=Schizopora paradoxa TaxID=27342 RepID=A0A0H2RQ17_9AGAM|nr:hypothetical protein SCHPADRAFT_939941 [Schizopora paradoxa]
MSDFDDFDDTFDSAVFRELDAIEASQLAKPATQATSTQVPPKSGESRNNSQGNVAGPSKPKASTSRASPLIQKMADALSPPPAQSRKVIPLDSDDFDMSFNFDESELAKLDKHCEDVLAGRAPIAGPSKSTTTRPPPSRSRSTVQMTLDGAFSPSKEPRTFDRARSFNRTNSTKVRPEKKWDRTAFSATGWMYQKKIDRQKEALRLAAKDNPDMNSEDEENEDEDLGFEQFPDPDSPIGYVPMIL